MQTLMNIPEQMVETGRVCQKASCSEGFYGAETVVQAGRCPKCNSTTRIMREVELHAIEQHRVFAANSVEMAFRKAGCRCSRPVAKNGQCIYCRIGIQRKGEANGRKVHHAPQRH